MRSVLRRARVLLGVYYALMIEYRGEIVMWAVATTLPLIMMGVWMPAGATGRFPLSEAEMVRYFIAVFVIRQFSVVWVIHDFEWHVVTGRLSPLLLQPIDPAWRFLAGHLSEQGARLPIVIGLLLLCGVLFPAAWQDPGIDGPTVWLPAWWQVGLFVAAVYAAFALRFLIQYCLSMLAFWFERVMAIEGINFIPYLFLSGLLAPLEVFPDAVRTAALFTPFPYMVWFPAKLLIDPNVEPAMIAASFAIILAWSVALLALNRWLWRRGLRHYSAMGA